MAQFGSALDWGSRGRGFKSRQPDQTLDTQTHVLGDLRRGFLGWKRRVLDGFWWFEAARSARRLRGGAGACDLVTPCDLVIPWCLQGLCCAWRLRRVGRVAGCGGRGCGLVCLQVVGRLGRCRCYPGPVVLGGSGRAGDSLISAVWVLVLVWFLRVRGERLHTLLALGQDLLAIRRAPAPAQA